MGRVLYLRFIGARVYQEAKARGLGRNRPLAVIDDDLVIDCDEKAWDDGVRPGDTLRQARISSPMCQAVRVSGVGGDHLIDILDILARISPYVEPVADESGVFVDIPLTADPAEILESLKGLCFKIFAAVSSSRLISRAASDLFLREYLERMSITSGKTKWGWVRKENSWVLALIEGEKEKVFISGAPLDSLWMAPPEVLSMLRSLGLKKVRDLQEVTVSQLAERIGDWAVMIKNWAAGEERSRVRALYPPPSITKEVNFLEPIPVQKEVFGEALKELAASLVEKGIGFKSITLSLSGDFRPLPGMLSGERKFVRPVSSLEAMRAAVSAILEGILEEFSKAGSAISPALTGFLIKLDDIAPVQAKPSPLFDTGAALKPKAVPVSLDLALFGLKDKFGERAVTWGKREIEAERFNPEIMRREKMLSIWDPMRPQFFDEAAMARAAGGVADV